MKTRCLVTAILISILAYSQADERKSHTLVKRQSQRSGNERTIPLSRSRQYPPPEELESSEYVNSEDEEEEEARIPAAPSFRGRQDQRPPVEEDYADEYAYTAAPLQTTPEPQKPTSRTFIFNNRFNARPRFGAQSSPTATTSRPTTASTPRRAAVATPAQSQRFDVVANILSKPPPPRPSERSISISRTQNSVPERKPAESSSDSTPPRRTNTNNRQRTRNRVRTRTSSTTTTTTTTTEKPQEEYYYYYEDEDEAQKNEPLAITTSTTTTTTTTKRPSLPRRVSIRPRVPSGRSQTTAKPVFKFDPESQFVPPPEDPVEVVAQPTSTKKFTTTSTEASPLLGGIPAHLRSKYKPRTDGRFIDFLRDPNRPRELKGFDLTDYPFYIKVPEDIDFECENKKDGYYASVPHRCQLFHYCFAGARYDFLCANYTLYDQTTFTCRFANNVDCEASEKFYYRNDDLWKETTTKAPETTTPKKRRSRPRDEDYEDEDYYEDDYDEEEEERRRPLKRRRNRRKNRRKPSERVDNESKSNSTLFD